MPDFYREYIAAVNIGEKVFVVERPSKTYNFFLDIDYVDHDELSVSDVKTITQIVCDKVKSLLGFSRALVSVAEPKTKNDKIKTGVHINWPNLVVNQDGAIQLMHHIVSTMNNVYLDRDWAHTIDASVYGQPGAKGSGFRLPWSHKKIKGVVEGVYLPLFEYDDGDLKSVDQEPTMEKLLMATVRTQCEKVVDVPDCVILCQPVKRKKEGDFTPGEVKNEVHDSQVASALESFIRNNMTGQSNTRVQKIFKCRNKYLLKTSSRYCENIKREHSSNHIKIVIEPGGLIRQECFCTCETTKGRSSGFCKDFKSRAHQLPPKITDVLYPPEEKKKKCLFKKPAAKKPKVDVVV